MTTLSPPAMARLRRADDFSLAGKQLAAILRVLVEKQHLLDKVLDRQRNALIHGKLAEIDTANLEAETILSEIERIDIERESLANRIARTAYGESTTSKVNPWSLEAEYVPPQVKLEEIMHLFNEEVRIEIEAPRTSLKQLIPITRRKLGANSALAMNGSKIVHATLGILTTIVGREGPDKHQIYGAQGKTHYGRTQVRSLLNRKV